jgi:hypothetical protein
LAGVHPASRFFHAAMSVAKIIVVDIATTFTSGSITFNSTKNYITNGLN